MQYSIIHAPVSKSTPNHMILPAIVYKETVDVKSQFKQAGWKILFESSVFDYHHYHPNTHEAIGVLSGEATLMIGGESGQKQKITQGQVLLLPAGYGHRLLESTEDFKVALSYPEQVDLKIETSINDLSQVNSEINSVPLPKTDPVYNTQGPMFKEWHNLYHCNTVQGG